MSCPPTSHTVKLMFLYSTVSTLNPERSGVDYEMVTFLIFPVDLISLSHSSLSHLLSPSPFSLLLTHSLSLLPIVGIVVTISPSLSLYRMVVFPAASSPTVQIMNASTLQHKDQYRKYILNTHMYVCIHTRTWTMLAYH